MFIWSQIRLQIIPSSRFDAKEIENEILDGFLQTSYLQDHDSILHPVVEYFKRQETGELKKYRHRLKAKENKIETGRAP